MSTSVPGTATPSEAQSSSPSLTKARNSILFAAAASLLVSVALWFSGHREEGLFVGLWVPSILGVGNLFLLTRGSTR